MVPGPSRHHVDDGAAIGVDCTAIPHVDRVSCASGKCTVKTCIAGWVPDAKGSACVAAQLVDDQSASPPRQGVRDLSLALPANTTAAGGGLSPVTIPLPNGDNEHAIPEPKADYLWRIPDY